MFLADGYSTLIAFGNYPSSVILLRERETQPPEVNGGGEIDVTTMRNIRMRTAMPKSLIKLEPTKMQCQYDPSAYTTIIGALQLIQLVTVIFPDGATLPHYGWIEKFTPTSHKEGDMPLAEVEVHFTSMSPLGGRERLPVMTAATAAGNGALVNNNVQGTQAPTNINVMAGGTRLSGA